MLKLSNISFSFGPKPVLKNISIAMEYGKVYGILGKNGAGKTTLFRNIMGWYQPNEGGISLDDEKISKEKIAFLETANYFYPYIKGREYLQLMNDQAMGNGQSLANVLNVPLDDLVDSYSTGMKKKLAFIGTLILNRPLILLDEPFNGVDLESNEVLKKLIQLNKPGKITLMSSHILSTLFDGCDTIFYLNEGQIRAFDKAEFGDLEKEIQSGIEEKMGRYSQS